MLVATFGPSTGWAGRAITYDSGLFLLADHGPITPADVMQYDRQGHLVWAYDGLREWCDEQAQQAIRQMSPTAQRGMPRWVWVVIAGAVLLIVLLIGAAVASAPTTSTSTSGSTSSQTDGISDTAPATLVTVFTWSGGGESNDIRNSQPFRLEGGHQVFSYTASPVVGEFALPSIGWTVLYADGSGGGEMISPSAVGPGTSDMYLSSGTYYVSANTLDVTWSVAIQEER